ncbi:MAG TPA: MFS transporter [Longimicrobiales bacterium]|nr:MFS transporter [Longimicrobiales bacterium]
MSPGRTGGPDGRGSGPAAPDARRTVPPAPGDGSPWRGLLRGNVLWLSVASFLNDASSEMIFPLLPLFLVGTLGAGPAFLGLVEGVAETTAAFVKLAGGWLSDRLRRRRALVAWGYAGAAATRPLMAAATLPWHVLAIRFGDRIGKGVRSAPRDALLAESVPGATRGRAFGVHRAADHAGAVLGPLLASGILLLHPGRLRLVFALAVIPAALAVLVVLARVREIAPAGEDRGDPAPGDVPAPAPLQGGGMDRGFVAFLVVLVLFTLGNASDAFLLLRAADLGVGVALIPLLWGALHVSKTGWNLVGGAVADRVGARPALVAGWVVYAGVYAGFALATESWHAWALFVGYGLFYGLAEPAEKVLVAGMAPSAARARAFGAYHFAIGIAALPASVVFGIIWEAWGAPAAFLFGAALSLAAAALLPLATRPAGPAA